MNKFVKHERINLPKGKSLTVDTRTLPNGYPLHWHSFFEIEIILSGVGKYVINDVVYDISEKNVFLLTPTDFHYLDFEDDLQLINISFDETMLCEKDLARLLFNDFLKAYSFKKEEYERLVNAADILRAECESDEECQKSLLQYVIKCLSRKNAPQVSTALSNDSFSGIKKAIIFIQMHFRENITLEQAATEVGYTPTYFSKLFKRATGESFIDMLTKYRIGCARTLLSNGFSVSDACFSSGFGSLSNFSEIFKKNFNMSPSQYKNSIQK